MNPAHERTKQDVGGSGPVEGSIGLPGRGNWPCLGKHGTKPWEVTWGDEDASVP
jgi:hypothetical protein